MPGDRRFAAVAVVVAFGLGVGSARARPASALETWAGDLADQAAAAIVDFSLADANLAIQVTARDPGRGARVAAVLAKRLAALLQRRPNLGLARVDVAPGAATVANASGFDLWLDVDLSFELGNAVLNARLVVVSGNLWQRTLRRYAPGDVVATLHAAAPFDAELRAYLTTPGATHPSVGAAPADPQRLAFRTSQQPFDPGAPVLAMTTADVDGDQIVELWILTTDDVVVMRAQKRGLREMARFPIPGAAPVPYSRTPVGTITFVSGPAPYIHAQTSAHNGSLVVGMRDKKLSRWPGTPAPVPTPAAGEIPPSPVAPVPTQARYPVGSFFDSVTGANYLGYVRRTGSTHLFGEFLFEPRWEALSPTLSPQTLAVAGTWLANATGPIEPVLAAVDAAGELRVFRSNRPDPAGAPWLAIASVGQAMHIADLDHDGRLEVVVSDFAPPGDGDQLRVFRVEDDGKTRMLFRSEKHDGGIAAITSGNLDGEGGDEIIAFVRDPHVTRGELWIVR